MPRISKVAKIRVLEHQNNCLRNELETFERNRDDAFTWLTKKANLCRTRAKIAWKRGKKPTHAKLMACARVWELAASEVNAINAPF